MTVQPLPVEGIPRAPQSTSRDTAWLHAAAGSCIFTPGAVFYFGAINCTLLISAMRVHVDLLQPELKNEPAQLFHPAPKI